MKSYIVSFLISKLHSVSSLSVFCLGIVMLKSQCEGDGSAEVRVEPSASSASQRHTNKVSIALNFALTSRRNEPPQNRPKS